MKTLCPRIFAVALTLLSGGIAEETRGDKCEEVVVTVPGTDASIIKSANDGTIESHLQLLRLLSERYEVIGILKTDGFWCVISKIRLSGNILLSTGGVPPQRTYRKTGLGNAHSSHVARTVDKNKSLWEVHVGREFKPLSDSISIACDVGHLTLPTRGEQADAGQSATRPESKPEGGDKPQPETEGRSR